MKRQLQDWCLFEASAVKRDTLRPGVLAVVEGLGQRSDEKNANGRRYSRSLWERVLPTVKERISSREMVGELDHPEGERGTSVKEISHVITKAVLNEDGTVSVAYEVLDTPKGRILDSLLRANVRIGISSRGEGELVERDGESYVEENSFRLETWDVVTNPSTRGAFPELVAQREEQYGRTLSALESVCNPGASRLSLLEARRIAESIETVEHVGRKERLLKSLNNSLSTAKTVEERQKPVKETKVKTKQNKAQIVGLIEAAANKKALALVGKRDAEINRLSRQVAEQARTINTLRTEVAAYSKVLEAAKRKIGTLGLSLKESGASALAGKFSHLKERYDALKQIAAEGQRAIQENKPLKVRLYAAKNLLEASHNLQQRAKLDAFIETELASDPNRRQISEMCRKARVSSIKEAQEVIGAARNLVGNQAAAPRRQTREPMPGAAQTPGTRRVVETTRRPLGEDIGAGPAFARSIIERCDRNPNAGK